MVSMHSLEGIRVLDLSRVLAGPWSTQILADLGAEVFKVERPDGGDDTRSWGPPFLSPDGAAAAGESGYYLGANRNKLSLTCNLASPEGQAVIRDLAKVCDVVVENFKVGNLAAYGLSYEALKGVNPRLVYCSITGFGQTGPYREQAGYDYVIQGMGGLMSVTGERDDLGGGPQKAGVAVTDLFTGLYATVAILAALRHAERTGQGQHLDLALLDVQVAMLSNHAANYLMAGVVPQRLGNSHANIVPYQVFEVKSRRQERDFLILAVGNDGQFARFCGVAGHPEWSSDPRFSQNAARVQHRAELLPLLEAVFKTRYKDEWLRALEGAKVPCGAINNLEEVFADPQVAARQMVDGWQHPYQDDLHLVASPIKMSETPVRRDLPPPLLGQHTEEVLSRVLGYSASKIAELRGQKAI